MLGKGLESLIPPQQSQGSGEGQALPSDANNGAVFVPQDEVPQPSPAVPENLETARRDLPQAVRPGSLQADNAPKPEIAGDAFRSKININVPVEKKEAAAPRKSDEDYIFHIEVSKIKPNPTQPRRNFDEVGIRELAYSIREFGFLQPLVVSKIEKEAPTGIEVEYQLIAGERRLLAAKMLGLEMVPAIIRRVDLEREKLELSVIENIQRENLNPIEIARAFARLQDEFRMTQREIAAKLGKSREVVANTVRLLSLPTYAQEALEKGQITESHGRFLLAIEDPAAQKKLFDDMLQQHLTMRELKERVQAEKSKAREPKTELSPELKMMEEKLSAELGTPVKIEKGVNTGGSTGLTAGKITITFYSEEELESIVRKIGKEEA